MEALRTSARLFEPRLWMRSNKIYQIFSKLSTEAFYCIIDSDEASLVALCGYWLA